ncbi:protein FAR1-RELATED SEQUENCE 5 [Beta vulgaris subsp. vulgaris]|uniref:protein FAR1-RELATED SEQUENCE 5 n=1 Tax=Beta vulgaris subsp. vulgaris TaxID=3555 RepID=UPI002036E8BB|nr:protein FAR1-RELATED SEQUENCE 5 [Beta vulgaris subsp. vulgaris]
MEFGVDGDVNGEVVGSSVDTEGKIGDENEMGGSSVEGGQSQDDRMNEEFSEKEVIPVGEPLNEPYVGQEFDSEAAAHAYYNTYATRVGFVIRVSKLSRSRRDGSAIGRALVCNKEGYRMADKREKVVRQRAETRVGCRAMILVRKMSSGKWVVTKFVKEHTHPLTPGKGRKDLIFEQYPNEHDKIRELSQQLSIERKRAATYKRHLEMVFEHIEEHNQSLSKKIQNIVDNVREFDSREKENRR